MKKVLVTSRSFGQIDDVPVAILQNAGFEIVRMDYEKKAFSHALPDFDALIIGAHRLDPGDLENAKKLKIVCKHGAGLDNIPLADAARLGIAVTNVPGTNAGAVADLAMGLMLCLARRVLDSANQVKAGIWKPVMGVDVCGKTLGLLGFGAIARNVAQRAAGFSMRVLAYDPYLQAIPEGFSGVTLCSLEEVLQNADFLSLHLPLTGETRDMLKTPQLQSMKQGAYLINTARGGIVNEADLREQLLSGHLAGAAVDVLEREGEWSDQPLLGLDNVIVTSHIGMYSKEAVGQVSLICAQNTAAFFSGEPLRFLVR